MKKTLYVLGLATAVLAISCTKDEAVFTPSVKGERLLLTGESTVETKVSIGEKDGSVYPLLWSEGDVIAIYSKNVSTTTADDGTSVLSGNIQGETAELVSGQEGKSSGVFQTTNEFSVTADEEILITYPGETVTYVDGVISGGVETFQTQRGSNSSSHLGNYASAFAQTTLQANQTEDVTFSLTQKTAFVKLVLSTTDFASYKLVGARLSSSGSELSGDIMYTVDGGQLTTSDTFSYVDVKYRDPVDFSSEQTLYFTALPADLSGKEVYVIITMQDGDKTVTIPAKVTGGQLKESCLTVITISNISLATNDCAWYEPVETRDLVDAWAFGPQNTYYVPTTPNPGELTIEVKARGDLSRISGAPKYYGVIAHSGQGGRKLVYTGADATYLEAPTSLVNTDDWTITVGIAYSGSSVGTWGVVGIFDENYDILWSFMICSYTVGDEPQAISYPNKDFAIMDRALGAPESHSVSVSKSNFDNNVAYFQWGRKDPFGWSNSGLSHYAMSFPPDGADVSTAIKYPYIVYAYTTGTDGDWQFKEHRDDLWGGVNNTSDWYDEDGVGTKTIYDPCPAGYRVPDARVLAEVQKNGEIWETRIGTDLKIATSESTTQCEYQKAEWVNTSSPVYGNDSVIAYPLGDGNYDYWPYHGVRYGNQANWGNRTITNTVTGACYWSNGTYGTGGVGMEYCYFSTSEQHAARHQSNRAQSFTIRCQRYEAEDVNWNASTTN